MPEETIVTREELTEVAEGTNLNSDQLMAALLEACGAKPKEIARRLGKAENYVYQLRHRDESYRQVVQELYGIVAKRIVDQVSDVDELFNRQIGPSAATLIEVRDNIWAKDSDRIKASLAFLDRASRAPKATSQVESRQTIIQIPITEMKNMVEALEAEGSKEARELLELVPAGNGGEGRECREGEGEKEFFEVKRM